MGDQLRKRAMKRLHKDMEELQNSPVANVAAVPLDSDMFEWHCNFLFNDQIYHILLFFPDNYPYRSPSAEFMPPGFRFVGGATKPGRRGVQVCLSIFSDFAEWHTEWADEKSAGWSPGYTVQTVLLNMISFLQDMNNSDYVNEGNLQLAKEFTCTQCGHTYVKPHPQMSSEDGSPTEKIDSYQIVDYVSKDRFKASAKPKGRAELFGYGLIVSGPAHRPALTTPCEFISGESFFGMQASEGKVKSIMKEDLSFFLPLYISTNHGEQIKESFEECIRAVGKILPGCKRASTPLEHVILKVIPNLMAATVVEFSKGTQHASDNHLQGYFALHRLLLWALETYPELQPLVESRLEKFMSGAENRVKKACPHIGEWLMLLSGSQKYTWRDASEAYLSESWRRNVMWYVKEDAKLGMLDTPQSYRIEKTYAATAVSRKILAFQVRFLDIAMPAKMKRAELVKRYDENLGFPTDPMVSEMKEACDRISKLKTYSDWFSVVKLPVPEDEEIFKRLTEALEFAIQTDGYHWSFWKDAGGWPQALKAYRATHGDPKKDKKAAAGKEKEKPAPSAGKGRGRGRGKAKKEESEEESEEEAPAKPAGRGRGRGRGAEKPGAKRKAEKEESEEESEEEAPAKPAGRGRGRGRGAKRKAEEAPAGRGAKRAKAEAPAKGRGRKK